MITLHVILGALGILAGFAAMAFAKGSARHRFAGNVYAAAMLGMCASALLIAVFLRPNNLNVVAATLTAYLVASAWLTVRRRPERPGAPEYASLTVGAAAAVLGLAFGARASNGALAGFCFVFGGIAALAVLADVRLLVRRSLTRTQRLVRHLWRMGFTLFVAAGSLFLGQAKHLPAWLTAPKLNILITLSTIGLLVFWLIRVRFAPWSRKSRSADLPLVSAR
jgi:hypothetical protein